MPIISENMTNFLNENWVGVRGAMIRLNARAREFRLLEEENKSQKEKIAVLEEENKSQKEKIAVLEEEARQMRRWCGIAEEQKVKHMW